MFCNQCEQFSRGCASTGPGICGKDSDVQSLQEAARTRPRIWPRPWAARLRFSKDQERLVGQQVRLVHIEQGRRLVLRLLVDPHAHGTTRAGAGSSLWPKRLINEHTVNSKR